MEIASLRWKRAALVLACAGALAACGGGGSDVEDVVDGGGGGDDHAHIEYLPPQVVTELKTSFASPEKQIVGVGGNPEEYSGFVKLAVAEKCPKYLSAVGGR